MLLRGLLPNSITKWSVLFACCVILYQVAFNRTFDASVLESLKKWKQGPDVYMRSLGYEFKWEEFKTGDGVNIKMHHFWKRRNNETGVPVLFQPTMFSNGDAWIMCNPNECFPYLLANCGYDVWIVNYRGSLYSPYKKANLSLTLDDYIREDLPGAIDYVLEKTGRKNLHLISYSKSTIVASGFLASRPEYNQKVRIHVSMVPATFFEDTLGVVKTGLTIFGLLSQDYQIIPWNKSVFIKFIDSNWFFFYRDWHTMGFVLQMWAKWFPSLKHLFLNFSITSRISLEPTFLDEDSIVIWFHNPLCDAVSHHEVLHLEQIFCAKKLQSFNYSQVPEEYRRNFSVITYDMSQITAATLILEASREVFSQPKDYQRIRAQHKNLIGAYRVKLPNYLHIDGIVGKDKNTIYGRAFASEMLKFDGDEMNSSCHFDPVEDYKNLEKMEVDSVAETPDPGFLKTLLSWPLERFGKDFCKYYT